MAILNKLDFETGVSYTTGTEGTDQFYSAPQVGVDGNNNPVLSHIEIYDEDARVGTQCLKFTIEKGIYRDEYPLCRSEVRTQIFGGNPGVMQGWIAFSFKALTTNTGQERAVIAQLWDGGSPSMSIRWDYPNNNVFLRIYDNSSSTDYQICNVGDGEWHDIVMWYQAREDSSGKVKIWHNRELWSTGVLSRQNIYTPEKDGTTPYWKFGNYSASFGEGNLSNRVSLLDCVAYADDNDTDVDTFEQLDPEGRKSLSGIEYPEPEPPEPENPYYPERTVPDDEHPISIDNQIFFCPANAVSGDQLGEVYFLFTFCRFWNEYKGTSLTEDQFTFTKVGGPSNFIVNSTTGMISVDNLVGFTEDVEIIVRVAIGGMHMDVTCNILYIPLEDCVYFDSAYAGGDSNGTREKPYLKFEEGILGNGTAGKTYLYKRGTTTTNQSAMFINPKVGGEYPGFINICAWGQGTRPIFTDTGAGEGNRTFTIGGQPWGNNPPDPDLAGHNIRLFDIETYKAVADQWYPILVKPVGDNIRMGRIKGSNTLFEHGIIYLPTMLHTVQGADDRKMVIENMELYNGIDRTIKPEASGIKCYNFRCKNDSSLGPTGSPAPTCASKPFVEFYYIDVEVENITEGGLGFQARGSHVIHKWIWAKGLRMVMTAWVHQATDGGGPEYLVDETSIFANFIIENCYQAGYFGRHAGTTDIVDGLQFRNINIKSCENGIRISDGAKNILVAYSNLSGCSADAGYRVYAAAGDGHKLHNCTLFDNTNQDINLQRNGVEIVNCNYGVIAGSANATITTSSNSRLQIDLVGAGTDLGYEFDLFGNSVADPPSIGAIEYAEIEIPTYDITASGANGAVTGTGTYNQGDPVSLEANPNPTFRFVKWVEGENEYTDNPYNFTATEDREFTAVFEKITHTITASGDNVTITGAGTHDEGSTAVLTAVPDEGFEFVKWMDGDEEYTDNPYSFTVAGDRNLTAVAQKIKYLVTATIDNGTVKGAGEIEHGDNATLTALPSEGFQFVRWEENNEEVSNDNPYIFEVTEPRELVAVTGQVTPTPSFITVRGKFRIV